MPRPTPPSMVTWATRRSHAANRRVRSRLWASMPSCVTWAKPCQHKVRKEESEEAAERGLRWATSGVTSDEALVSKIMEILPARDRIKARRVCKTWRQWADDPLVWIDVAVACETGGACAVCSDACKASIARGLRQLAGRCFTRTQTLAIPLLPAADLERVLSEAPALQSLSIHVAEHEYQAYSENGLVAIGRVCRKLDTLRHPLPPSHFDSDERLHRSSLRLVCKTNPGLAHLDFSLPPRGEHVMVHRLIDALHHAPALQHLSVRNCTNVDDRIVRPLGGRPIETIDVRGTSVSYRALEALAASCPTLKAVAADPRGSDESSHVISERLRSILLVMPEKSVCG